MDRKVQFLDGSELIERRGSSSLEESLDKADAADDAKDSSSKTTPLTSSYSRCSMDSNPEVRIGKRPKKSSIRKSISPMTAIELKKLEREVKLEQKAVEVVEASGELLKWSRYGRKLKRTVKLGKDATCLEISSKQGLLTGRKIRTIEFSEVERMTFGPRSKTFEKFDWRNDKGWTCFSIFTAERSWDFQVENEDVAMLWFFGLQSLCPKNKHYIRWGRLLWLKAFLKTVRISARQGVTIDRTWNQLVSITKSCKDKGILYSEDGSLKPEATFSLSL